MFFGEFLVQKNIITQDQLVEALVSQVKSTASYAEICFDKKIFTPKQLLEIFSMQINQGIEFKTAAINLNFWSSDVEEKVENYLMENKIPLGQILVKQNITQYDILTKLLDEFLSIVSNTPDNKSKAVSSSKAESPDKTKSSLSSAVFSKVDPDIAKEYFEKFSESYLTEMRNIFDKMNDENLAEHIYMELHKMLHTLTGAAKFSKMNLSAELLLQIESMIKKVNLNYKNINSEQFSNASSVYNSALDALWLLRDCLQESFSEETFWNDNKEMYQKIISNLKAI